MDLLFSFLNENYYMLAPVLWVIGFALKNTPRIPDWTIIWILLGLSIGFGVISYGFHLEVIMNGIIAAGVAVLGHQMFKQTVGARNVKKKVITVEEKKTEIIEHKDVKK